MDGSDRKTQSWMDRIEHGWMEKKSTIMDELGRNNTIRWVRVLFRGPTYDHVTTRQQEVGNKNKGSTDRMRQVIMHC